MKQFCLDETCGNVDSVEEPSYICSECYGPALPFGENRLRLAPVDPGPPFWELINEPTEDDPGN